MRVDIFGIKQDGTINGRLIGPLRPEVPTLEPGKDYLVEVVIRTLKVGHVFTQGTADSNELWVDVLASQDGSVIGRSGAMDPEGFVDPWSHFVNALVLDHEGNRIDRRNAEDIFVPLYSNQQPPGSGQVVHYRLHVPEGSTAPVVIDVRLNYRKFDQTYMNLIYDDLRRRGRHEGPTPELPVVVMASDRVVLPVRGGEEAFNPEWTLPVWQRWRDYGIGLFREGNSGSSKGELRQAEEVFRRVAELHPNGWVDLARVYEKEGRLEEARAALESAVAAGVEATWTVNWLSGLIDRQNGHYDRAIAAFEGVLATRVPERGFDFSRDYLVQIDLGKTHFLRARELDGDGRAAGLRKAADAFERALQEDSENATAHYNLMLVYRELGDDARSETHRRLHARYKPDESARDRAVAIHRAANPAADHAAESIVIRDLHRDEGN